MLIYILGNILIKRCLILTLALSHSAKKAKNAENFSANQEKLLTLTEMPSGTISFITVDFTAQMQYFMMRVANFETL